MLEYLCRKCGRSYQRYNSLQRLCGVCQYNASKPRKRLRRIGKVGAKWIETRREYIETHPPDSDGKWPCYLGVAKNCLKRMTIDELTLDHMLSRTRRPDLRFDQTNLAPCCLPCNELKGSLNYIDGKLS